MNNNDEIKKQDDYLKSNINNILSYVKIRNSSKFSSFLDEHQRDIAVQVINHNKQDNCCFFGGAKDCERVMLGAFTTDKPISEDEFPITAIKVSYSDKIVLTHRDFLGSLMGLQLKREMIGDIFIKDCSAIIFVDNDVVSFILSNLDKIGRTQVSVSVSNDIEIERNQEYKELTGTVPSLRLDCIIALIIGKSRTIAAQTIKSNIVKVNYIETQNLSKILAHGDIITIRGKGKFIIGEDMKKTKKDRIFITINQLL